MLPAMTSSTASDEVLFDRRYRAVASRDRRFDGYFFTAVTSTRIYCRPSCPAGTPGRDRVRFYPTAAAAQGAGFRACKRCIPGAAPGSPEWDLRGDVAGRAMRLIDEGLVEREGVPGLARRLGYSERQLRRILEGDLGAAPLALARAQRAGVARLLLETTDLPITEVAFAAGFASLRQFNDTIREIHDTTPTALRERGRRRGSVMPLDPHVGGTIGVTAAPRPTRLTLRLARRNPFDLGALLAFLGPRSIPGVESVAHGAYTRSLRLPHGAGLAEVRDGDGVVACTLTLADPRDLAPAVARVRRLLDLDADPAAVAEALGGDPVLGPLVAASPGRRAPGAVDGLELAIRAIAGQQVSVASATRVVGRIAEHLGTPLAMPAGPVTHLFPDAATLADAPDDALPVPKARRATIRAISAAIAEGTLDLGFGADREEARVRLQQIPGIGPWTAGYISLRALGDPDVLLTGDLGVRKAATRLGLPGDPAALAAHGIRWAPWRSYATHHLWASLGAPEPPALPASSASPIVRVPHRPGIRGVHPMTVYTQHPSPIGNLLLVGEPDGDGVALRGLYMEEHRHGPAVDPAWVADDAPFAEVERQLDEYFAAGRREFDLELAPRGTAFQLAVWDQLRLIPAGETTTYGELARRVGRPAASRAVGAAVGRNPISIIVPCHRVVGSGGALTGYAGGLDRKRTLLALEQA
jgi:AraC family transcriptional regulator, regulatory protein of adaptative response / DNA-3-methyladenine glycosylase II